MNTRRTLSASWLMLMSVILIASACGSPQSDAVEEPARMALETPAAVDNPPNTPAATVEDNEAGDPQGNERLTALTGQLADSSVDGGLILWGNQTMFGVVEVERYERLEDLAQRASTVVVGTVLGAGPSREVHGDPGTDDVVTYESTEIEVIEVLAGTREVRAGDRLIVESFRAPSKEGVGTVAVLFLRNKQDTNIGEPNPKALPGEAGIYRLISHQGVFIDRGDGVPVNPISEVMRLIESGDEVPLDEFVFGDNVPRAETQPIAAQARALTMDELLQLITKTG